MGGQRGHRLGNTRLKMFPALAASVAGRLSGVVTGFGPPSSSVDASQLVPYFGQFLSIAEAENFTSSGGGWEPRSWAHSPGLSRKQLVFEGDSLYLDLGATV